MNMTLAPSKIAVAIFGILTMVLASAPLFATTYTWNTDTSGSYQTTTNWSPNGTPGSGDIVALYRPTNVPVTVTLNGDATATIIYPMNPGTLNSPSNFTMDLNGYNMTTVGSAGTEGGRGLSMYSGGSSATTLSFTINNSAGTQSKFTTTYLTMGVLALPAGSVATPTLTVTGPNTVLETLSFNSQLPYQVASTIGLKSKGIMTLSNGAKWNNNVTPTSIVVGSEGVNSSLLVTGAGTQINAATAFTALNLGRVVFTVGAYTTASMQIADGATVTTDDMNIGQSSSVGFAAAGSLTVSDASSTLTTKRLFLGGGVNNGAQTGTSGAAVGSTGTLTVSNNGTVNTGDILVYAGGTVNYTAGTLTTTGLMEIQGGQVTGNGTIGGTGGVAFYTTTGGRLTASGGTLSITNGMIVGINNADVQNAILAGTINVGGTTTVRNAATLTVNGTLGGAGALTLGGSLAGTGTINKAVTLAGNSISSAGTLSLGSTLTIGASTNTIASGTVAANGATSFSGSSRTLTVNGTLGGSGNLDTTNGTINGSGTINKTGGTISGTGTVGGTVTTTLANGAITGGTFTNAVVANASAISGGTYSSSLTLGNGSTITGLTLANGLTIGGTGATVNSGTTTANGATTVNDGATLAVNGTLGGSGSFGFGGTAAAGLSGTGTISKAVALNGNKTLSSSGTLTLGSTLGVSGAGNAISTGTVSAGATSINSGGALAVNGTLSGANGVSVDGILSGSGIINKAVTVNSGGTLSPGNSPGNLSMSSLTLAAGGNYNWQIYDATGVAGTAFDTITVSGALDLTGLSTSTKYAINLWSLSGIAPDANGDAINFNSSLTQSWTLIGAGSLSGPVGNINDYFQIFTAANNGTNGFSNTFTGAFSIGTSGNDLVLNYTAAIPEPSTYVLMGLGAAVLLFVRKRKFFRAG